MAEPKERKALKPDWEPIAARIPPKLKISILAKLAPNKRMSDLVFELLDKANNGRFLGIESFKK